MEELTNYQVFTSALKTCTRMAKEYLSRCIIDGRVDSESLYYFKNLFSLQIDEFTNVAKIICSNSDPNCQNESTKSYNIRFITIDENLFNKSSEEFDMSHIDQALLSMIKRMNSEQKDKLYNALREIMGSDLEDLGGL